MNLLLLVAALGAIVTGGVLAVPDCTTEVTKCADAYKATTSTIDKTNQQALCDALIVEYDCLKLCDAFCTGSDRSALDTALNDNVLPTLIQACPGQVCEADLASCTNNYTTGQQLHQNDQHLICRDAAQFEVCLSNIQSTCKPEQQAQITATLQQIRPKVSQACKGEDCQVQATNCNDLWSQLLNGAVGSNNKQLTCVSDMGLIICLQDIEAECTPPQKAAIDAMVTPATKRLTDNCKGQGCSPKLIECTANWNTSIQAAKTLDTQCTADKGYEDCLHDSEVFCTSQEKTNVETLLKPIAPKITEHCGGVGDVKPWSFMTLLFAGSLLVKRFI
ncbi:hypothetical protein LOTGIDRAFT_236188 [Lottia gigantea]|uniref:Uncharacterized protein n=1 Tax=Lottia gigantea TaxID=225164 RepID=V3ZQB3_LOTGI|nr:hypothetical protein LOTGIDRAFT_236188 [Lottia gigantea]ESO84695.1 hypothetical protein LOTGIDRAFT_236188 [Lottia gigantea]